ncbi:hypothetical protein DICVIV_05998 [Dictyocaulus viviparus]|uniref:Uncharacterized protein n=1 Tax=Dictyocaulus viviparus TaxID=29172 RepID=A0A0D8Y008_DICVI|nr:hypothetical protein DICVIV_05998 [Dictyocaulus viviparus]
MHHSSEYYNLSTALRQGAIQDMFMMFFDLSQAIAIPPNIFIAHRFLNLLYQFWLHANVSGSSRLKLLYTLHLKTFFYKVT